MRAGGGAVAVEDARSRVAALEAEVVVELDAQAAQVVGAGGRLLGQDAHRARPAEPAARAQRVLGVIARIVVRPDRGRDAALGEEARRSAHARPGDDDDLGARLGRGEGGGQAGDAGADDGQISSGSDGNGHLWEFSPQSRKPQVQVYLVFASESKTRCATWMSTAAASGFAQTVTTSLPWQWPRPRWRNASAAWASS